MANQIDLTKVEARLKENITDYGKIFSLKLANGFGIKADPMFTVLPIKDKLLLTKSTTKPILQEGRTGAPNFTTGVIELTTRWGQLQPFKADLKIEEQELYAWGKNYLGSKKPTDPTDIYSFNAMAWYMEQIYNQAGKDMHGVIFDGVKGGAGANNTKIADGLKLLFTQGIATTGPGAVGDIPADNVIAAAAVIDQTNVLIEINKLAMRIIELCEESDEDAILNLDPMVFAHMINALNSQLSNSSQYVVRTGSEICLALLPNTRIVKRKWLKSTPGKMFWTPLGNFFWLAPEENTTDLPSIQVEKADRAIKIFIDGEMGVNYGDGRVLFMNSK